MSVISIILRLLLLTIVRGFISGVILTGVTRLFKVEKSNFAQCFKIGLIVQAIDAVVLYYCYYANDVMSPGSDNFTFSDDIELLLGSGTPNHFYTGARIAAHLIFFRWLIPRFLSTEGWQAFFVSLVTVLIYFLVGAGIGYILLSGYDWYSPGLVPAWF